ncbi:hypothetical protein ACQKWADRAFT_331057 [Trichoderma austrokoningii]
MSDQNRKHYKSKMTRKDYDTYGDDHASIETYYHEYESQTGSRDTDINTLSRPQHTRLAPPAGKAANDQRTHANARADFLDDYPHG